MTWKTLDPPPPFAASIAKNYLKYKKKKTKKKKAKEKKIKNIT